MESKDHLRFIYQEGFSKLAQYILDNFTPNGAGLAREISTGQVVELDKIVKYFIPTISSNVKGKNAKEKKVPEIILNDLFELEELGYRVRWFGAHHCRINGYIDVHPISGKYKDLRTGIKKQLPKNILVFIPSIIEVGVYKKKNCKKK